MDYIVMNCACTYNSNLQITKSRVDMTYNQLASLFSTLTAHANGIIIHFLTTTAKWTLAMLSSYYSKA